MLILFVFLRKRRARNLKREDALLFDEKPLVFTSKGIASTLFERRAGDHSKL